MNCKRSKAVILIIMYIAFMLPFNFGLRKARAAAGTYTTYNAENTATYNKYRFKGIISDEDMIQYEDSVAFVESDAFVVIKDGSSRIYQFPNEKYNYRYAGRCKDNVYFLAKKPDEEGYEKQILRIDLKGGSINWEDYSSKLTNLVVNNLIVDNEENKYFCLVKTNMYVFVKISTDGSTSSLIYTSQYKPDGDRIENLYCDKDNKIWFSTFSVGNDTKYFTDSSSTISMIQNNYVTRKYSCFGEIRDYKVIDNGEIWFIPEYFGNETKYSNYVAHLDSNGKLISGYNITGARSIFIDSNGNTWILDSKAVKKLENGKFVDKYHVPDYMSKLCVDKDGRVTVLGENEIIFINGNARETIKVDAFVRNHSYVTNDIMGNIKIIGKDPYKYYNLMITSINKDDSKKSRAVSLLNAVGKSNSENKKEQEENLYNININDTFKEAYKTARAYYDDVYIYAGQGEIYRINGTDSKLLTTLDNKICGMELKEVDNKLLLYAVSKEIKQNNIDTINVVLSSYEPVDINNQSFFRPQQDSKSIPIMTGQIDNSIPYNLDKVLMNKDKELYISVEEPSTKKRSLLKVYSDKKLEEEFFYKTYFPTNYISSFVNEDGEIEYVRKIGEKEDSITVWKAYYIKYPYMQYYSYYTGQDTRFDKQSEEFRNQIDKIKCIVKAKDDRLFVLVGDKVYTKGSDEKEFKLDTRIKKANSIVCDKHGRVYIGTDGYGVVCYCPTNFNPYRDWSNPGIAYMNVAKDSKNVPIDININIQFNENLKPGNSFNSISLKDRYGVNVPSEYILNGSVLTIKPDKLLYKSSIYTVTLPANVVMDVDNRSYDTALIFSFTTEGEKIPPVITKANVDKKTGAIEIIFSEEVEKTDNYGKILFTDSGGKTIRFSTSLKNKVLIIKPVDKLVKNTKYKINIPSNSVMDIEGNKMEKGFNLYFLYK